MSTNQPKYICGIDYSMTCPAICFHPVQEKWEPKNITLGFLSSVKKYIGTFSGSNITIISSKISDHKNIVLRGLENANSIIDQFNLFNCDTDDFIIGLEGYAYGAKGSRVFDIGEHTCMLKFKFINNIINDNLIIIEPTVVKKHATGKGNANKLNMIESMIDHSNIDLYKIFNIPIGKTTAPINDLADAYWMCNYIFNKIKQDY